MRYGRWLAVLAMCIAVTVQGQPASAARVGSYSTVLRMRSSTGLAYPLLHWDSPGTFTIIQTIACGHVTAGADPAPPADAGDCQVHFEGEFVGGASCLRAVGVGTGSVVADRMYPFSATFELTADTLTMTGTVVKDGQHGPIAVSGALTSDPFTGASCLDATKREYIFAGTFSFAID